MSLPAAIKEALAQQDSGAPQRSEAPAGRDEPSMAPVRLVVEVPAEAIAAALREQRWNITRSARSLGVSRNTLIARIRETPGLRLAGDLTSAEITAAVQRVGADVEALVDELQVSAHGLRLRMKELGLRGTARK